MNAGVVCGALLVGALNLLAGGVGSWLWYREEPSEERLQSAFWRLLRIAQVSSVLLALAVGGLAAGGYYSSYRLFYLYALLPLAVSFVAEQLRIASAETILEHHGLPDAAAVGTLPPAEQQAIVVRIVRREMGVMTLSALVVVFLALRAASTAHGF